MKKEGLFIAGVDEAGRGCVFGSMIVAILAISKKNESKLYDLGIRDSKKLSHKKRLRLYEKLVQMDVEFQIREVTPYEIDHHNLTSLTKKATIELIQKVQPDQVFLDVPAPPQGVANYLQNISSELDQPHIEVFGSNKGEDNFIVVAGASIIAKVIRDQMLEVLKQKVGDFGSAYPSDPKTIAFLKKILSHSDPLPSFVRTKWKTIQNLKQMSLPWN